MNAESYVLMPVTRGQFIIYCAHAARPVFPTVLFSSLMSEGQSSSSVIPKGVTGKNLVY